MALVCNLEKSTQALTLCLQKAGIATPPIVDLEILMDVSGSFEDEHLDGTTNDLLTRFVPWALTFDPDKKLGFSSFSNGPKSVVRTADVTAQNYHSYMRDQVIQKVAGWNGATDYSYAIEEALRNTGWLPTPDEPQKPKGLFGRLFGGGQSGAPVAQPMKRRSLIVMPTDGDNSDKDRTRRVLRESEARKDAVYFLFLAISNQGSTFPFLDEIADEFGNTGVVHIPNIKRFVAMSDEDLNQALLGQELLDWLRA